MRFLLFTCPVAYTFIMKLIISVVLIALLCSCAASVKYAERVPGFRPGYVDERLGEHSYQVRVGEAWPKDWHDLEKFAMFRAAEITQQSGFKYFAVTSSSTRVNSYSIAVPQTTKTNATITAHGDLAHVNATSTTTGGGTTNIRGGWYTLGYRLITEEELPHYENIMDSEAVIDDLRYFIDRRR